MAGFLVCTGGVAWLVASLPGALVRQQKLDRSYFRNRQSDAAHLAAEHLCLDGDPSRTASLSHYSPPASAA